jgi:type IV secretory pathway VirB2 component (pilin)
MQQLSLPKAMSSARATSQPPESADDATAPSVVPGYLLLGGAIVSVCVMCLAWAFGSRDCRIKPLQFVFGITDLSVTTSAGMPCTIVVRPGSAALDALTIESQPKHGTVTARGRTGVVYRPHPKFRGDDGFTFSIRGGPGSPHETSVIRVLTNAK